jgi:predicted transcriptional regulator of viral defense system
MKFTDYINSHHAFTTARLMSAMDSPDAAEEQLRLAVKSGSVERARRGLLVSNHGRYQDAPLDPVELLAALDPAAVLSYHSALGAWGVAHDAGFTCRFRSDYVRSAFAFRGVSYEPCGPLGGVPVAGVRTSWGRRRVTTREQTVFDCLGRPHLSGGAEEAVRGASAFVWLDVNALARLAVGAGPSAAARAGWLLEQKQDDWHVGEEALTRLQAALSHGPYRLGHVQGEGGWSARWRLVLPESNEEVTSWITHT